MSDNVIDKVLRAGTIFDWITPTIAFGQDALNGPSATFGVSEKQISRPELKRLLNSQGITSWGLMFKGRNILFTVRKADEKTVAALLKREGLS